MIVMLLCSNHDRVPRVRLHPVKYAQARIAREKQNYNYLQELAALLWSLYLPGKEFSLYNHYYRISDKICKKYSCACSVTYTDGAHVI